MNSKAKKTSGATGRPRTNADRVRESKARQVRRGYAYVEFKIPARDRERVRRYVNNLVREFENDTR